VGLFVGLVRLSKWRRVLLDFVDQPVDVTLTLLRQERRNFALGMTMQTAPAVFDEQKRQVGAGDPLGQIGGLGAAPPQIRVFQGTLGARFANLHDADSVVLGSLLNQVG